MGENDQDWLDSLSWEEARRLTWNGNRIQSLQNALAQLKSRIDTIPDLISEIIQEGCWRKWADNRGKPFSYSKAEFRRFIEADRPDGCQTPLHELLKAVEGTEALSLVNDALRGDAGPPEGNQNAPGRDPVTGMYACTTIRDEITDCGTPTIISLRTRDYHREVPTGTSVSYAVRRLKENRPDLYDRVKAGELTAHGAMVTAGFKLRSITIDDDPQRAARRLLKHFQGDRLAALIAALREGLS